MIYGAVNADDLDWSWDSDGDWNDGDESSRKRQRPTTADDYYKIVSVKEKHVHKFHAYMYDYNIQFRNLEEISFEEALPILGNIFGSIIERMGEGVQDDDRVRMVFDSPVLNFPISLPFMRMDEFDRIQTFLNSYQFIRFDETATIHFVHMKCLLKLEELLASKRSIVIIKDDGTNTCLACAIVVGQALQEK